MAAGRNGPPKTGPVRTVSALDATRLAKPKFNGYACGHGVHGDTKYNRARAKSLFEMRLRAMDS